MFRKDPKRKSKDWIMWRTEITVNETTGWMHENMFHNIVIKVSEHWGLVPEAGCEENG